VTYGETETDMPLGRNIGEVLFGVVAAVDVVVKVPFKLKWVVSNLFILGVLFSGAMARADELQPDLCGSDAFKVPLLSETDARIMARDQSTSTKLRSLKLVVIASGDFAAGRADAAIFEEIDRALLRANEYLKVVRVKLELAGVQVFEPGVGDPYADAASRRDANAMLSIARAEWTGRQYPQHDLVAVFGRSAFGSTYGLAYPSTVCLQPRLSFLFVSQGGGDVGALNFGATLAHEVGHSLGMSHDGVFYPEGPSLMWPFFAANVNSYSKNSLAQFDTFEGAGGLSCLEELSEDATNPGETSSLSFSGGAVQERVLTEGLPFDESFQVTGNFPGVSYEAKNLPLGAEFDKHTGELRYTPPFSTVEGKKQEALIEFSLSARTFQLEATTTIRFRVIAANQAPRLILPSLALSEGVFSRQEFSASDADAGDKASIKLLNKKDIAKLPGKPKMKTSSSSIRLDWTPPRGAAGDYPLLISASDKSGGTTTETLILHVERNEPLPNISAPTSIEVASGNRIESLISADGATRGLDVSGLKPGMLLLRRGTDIELRYAPMENEKGTSLKVEIQASSLGGSRKQTITLDIPKSADISPVVWPGTSRKVGPLNDVDGDAEDDLNYYHPLSGEWRSVSCRGVLGQAFFGGFVSDVPLLVHQAGKAVRAIFRVSAGQGWWYLDDGSTPVAFGLARDIPLAADLDGDGKDELIVYRPRTSEWFALIDGVTKTFTPFEHSETERSIPFAADIDGDGRAELIVFRRLASGDGVFEAELKDGTDLLAVVGSVSTEGTILPVLADMDGDGRADFAVQSSGQSVQWFSTSGGKIESSGEAIRADSVFGFRRCGSAGASLVVSGTQITEQLLVTPESAALRTAIKNAISPFGAFGNENATPLTLLRRDKRNAAASWLRRSANGFAEVYAPLPDLFGYQTSAHLSSLFDSELLNYGDGVWFSQNPSGELSLAHWGRAGDVPVPGDYNGDGIDDLAIYRSADHSWWILFRGKATAAKVVLWGEKGDVPVPADYDGDGITDIAVWRPSTGAWYIRFADGSVRTQSLGVSTDVPLAGDYLGDGRAEIAVWSPQNGRWSVQLGATKDTLVAETFGLGEDTPVRGDFDGNGSTDLALYRASIGVWYFKNIFSAGGGLLQFGLPTDTPLAAQKTLRTF